MAHRKFFPWILGILVASLLMGGLFAYVGFSYTGSDDIPLLRSFMGFEGGVPAHYSHVIHTFLAWLLYGLAMAFPGMAWFSILQLFFLWFSCVVIVKSMAQCASRGGFSPWLGAVVGTLFLAGFAAFQLCRITFTTTSALLGAAAVIQLLSVDWHAEKRGSGLGGMLLSIALLLACYSLRQVGVIAPFLFWGLAVLALGLRPLPEKASGLRRSRVRTLLAGLTACVLAFAVFAGVRAIETKALGLEDYLKWQQARVELFDYTDFGKNTPPETIEELGWSPAQFKLVSYWFFMDPSVTAEAFEKLASAQPENAPATLPQKLSLALQTVRDFMSGNPHYFYLSCMLLLMGIGCALLALGKSKWLGWVALAGILLGAALLFYLGYQRRLPARAAVTVLFPLGTFLLGLWFTVAPLRPAKGSKILSIALCVLVLGSAAYACLRVDAVLHPVVNPEDTVRQESIPVDFDTLALQHPDMLIITDLSLIGDRRMFPDTSAGIPPNIMFWGGYLARSPSWNAQLERYGIDPQTISAKDFLRENVLVASTDGAPWDSLLAYVDESAPGDVDWDFFDEYGYVGFFQLYEY